MKVNTAIMLEWLAYILIFIIFFPIGVINLIFCLIQIVLSFILLVIEKIIEIRDILTTYINHKLFLMCDEKKLVEDTRLYNLMSPSNLKEYLKKKDIIDKK